MLLKEKFAGQKIILASQSPRRKDLLSVLDIPFEVGTKDVEEVYPEDIQAEEVPSYLAKLKASPFDRDDQTLILSADTIVLLDGEIFGKPKDYKMAKEMLLTLSGKKHRVITGVCLTSGLKQRTFSVETSVVFKRLTEEEIKYYLENYAPYDKAGAYGIQEWIGYVGVRNIDGSYSNVMGLPVEQLYEELCVF